MYKAKKIGNKKINNCYPSRLYLLKISLHIFKIGIEMYLQSSYALYTIDNIFVRILNMFNLHYV